MDDMISRSEAIEALKRAAYWQDGERKIAELPAVDAVPVVRCKDCKHRPIDHRKEYDEMTGFGIEFPDDYCPCQCEDGWYNWFPGDDWYCAYGERRDEDETDRRKRNV